MTTSDRDAETLEAYATQLDLERGAQLVTATVDSKIHAWFGHTTELDRYELDDVKQLGRYSI